MNDEKEIIRNESVLESIHKASLLITVFGVSFFLTSIIRGWILLEPGLYSMERIRDAIEFITLVAIAMMIATNAALISARAKKVDKTLLDTQHSMTESESRIKDASGHLDNVLKEVRKTKKIAVDTAFSVIEKILGLSKSPYESQNDERSLQQHEEWLGALRHHFNAWDERLRESSKMSEFALSAWLAGGTSYFTEEAYDVHRGELVTNARNYVYILGGLAANLIRYAQTNGQTLYYYTFTPANPKDWYQYPHGRVKPYIYYEEDFVAVFYRSLNAIIKNSLLPLKHRRYIICVNGDDETKKKISIKIGSDIEKEEKIKSDLINISMQLVPLKNGDFSSHFGSLSGIYHLIKDHLHPIDIQNKRRIYMWSTKKQWNEAWTNDPLKQYYDLGIKGHIDNLPINQAPEFWMNTAEQGLKSYKSEWSDDRDRILKPIFDKLKEFDGDLANVWKDVWNLESTWLEPEYDKFDYPKLLDSCHRLSIALQHDSIRQILSEKRYESDLMHKLIYMGLTCRDLHKRWLEPHTPKLLRDEFAQTLHTEGINGLFLLPIKDDPSVEPDKYWLTRAIEPEVSLFGTGLHDATIDKIRWGLAVAVSNLNYPFEIVRIKFKTGEAELNIYKQCLQQIEIQKKAIAVSSL